MQKDSLGFRNYDTPKYQNNYTFNLLMSLSASSLPMGGLSAENVDNILCDEEVPDSTFRKLGTQLN